MTETAADEQDLAKALDSVADASADLGGTSSIGTSNGVNLPPITTSDAAMPPVFPPITPVTTPSDPASNDAPTPFTPQPHVAEPPALPPLPDLSSIGTSDSDSAPDPMPSSLPTPDPVPAPQEPVKQLDTSSPTGPLADIKKDALSELRPLVDKLSVSAEEKFDTYLLLIRSTDDTNLIAPAHEAAKAIPDEARRAEALLDIIKEIDYLSRQQKPSDD